MRIPENQGAKDNELRSRRGRRPAPLVPVDLSSLEQRTGFLLYRVSSVARDIYSKQVGQLDIRPTQVGILQLLAGSGSMIQGMIADKLGIDKPAMVALLHEMERRGLVCRSRHPDDDRALVLQLSDQGSALLRRVEVLNDESTDVLLSALTPDERHRFHSLLMKIYQSKCKE